LADTGASALAIYGAVTGSAGLLISLLVYRRDTARIRINLDWDHMVIGTVSQVGGWSVRITIWNEGRRPAFISDVHVPGLAKGDKPWAFESGFNGTTIPEGGAPFVVLGRQEQVAGEWADRWWRVRGAAYDATGRRHLSDWPVVRPSFATADPPPLFLPVARAANWARQMVRRVAG
jgi:hypothetical protein